MHSGQKTQQNRCPIIPNDARNSRLLVLAQFPNGGALSKIGMDDTGGLLARGFRERKRRGELFARSREPEVLGVVLVIIIILPRWWVYRDPQIDRKATSFQHVLETIAIWLYNIYLGTSMQWCTSPWNYWDTQITWWNKWVGANLFF